MDVLIGFFTVLFKTFIVAFAALLTLLSLYYLIERIILGVKN